MKNLFLILLCNTLLILSCKEERQKLPRSEDPSSTSTEKTAKKEIHYICNNNCENSGSDVAGNCPTCKTPYTHNVAFHNDEFLKNGPLKVEESTQGGAPASSGNTVAPARNNAGIYHYTCSNACAGGSGTAENCSNCGTLLVHNQAYH